MAKKKIEAVKYFEQIASGKIVACKQIKRLAEIMLPRFKEGKYKRWHFDVNKANKPVTFIEGLCKLPSGKLGADFKLELFQKAFIQTIFGWVDKDGNRQFLEVLEVLGRKNGKALSLDTPIPTPGGWKTMGEIHNGDFVFGQDGKPARVLIESQIFDKPMYLVTFEDDEQIKASADHIWTVETKWTRRLVNYQQTSQKSRPAYSKLTPEGYKNITTEEMANDFSRIRHDKKGTDYKYRVPMCEPVEYPKRKLPIDPYLLGVWLGDGTSSKQEITCSDTDVDEMMYFLANCGYPVSAKKYVNKEKGTWVIQVDNRGRNGGVLRDGSFRKTLKELNLLNNKHIPDVYLISSIEQRKELLKGLMDTDGYCSKAGQCEFTQKNKEIVYQVKELLSSLGIKSRVKSKAAKCNGKNAGIVYHLTFFVASDNCCFKLGRKAARLKENLAPRMRNKSIVNIEKIPNEPSKCIMVDNANHLYLAGKSYTANHNTSLGAALELYMLVGDGEGSPQVYNVASSRDQASLAYGAALKMMRQSKALNKHLRKGTVPERDADGILCSANMGYISVLSGQTRHLDGLDVHFALIDELAAILNRDLYDLIKQGMSARDQPLLMAISTNGFLRGGIFDSQVEYAEKWLKNPNIDDRFLPFIYMLDERSEWTNEKAWIKANPGLGTIKKIEALRGYVKKAKNDPEFLPTVLTKDFNLPENAAQAWLSYPEAVNTETFELKGFDYCIIGFDASDTTDLTAARAIMMRKNDPKMYEIGMYWIPEDTITLWANSGRRTSRDDVPYEQWIKRGLIRTVPGNKIDKGVIVDWIYELKEMGIYTYAVGYDPWHIDDSTLRNMKMAVGDSRCFPIKQGAQTLSQPMKQIKAEYRDNNIIDNHNPINEWCRMNVSVKTDNNDNIQPIKKLNNSKNRIDGFVAELCAYTVFCNERENYLALVG